MISTPSSAKMRAAYEAASSAVDIVFDFEVCDEETDCRGSACYIYFRTGSAVNLCAFPDKILAFGRLA